MFSPLGKNRKHVDFRFLTNIREIDHEGRITEYFSPNNDMIQHIESHEEKESSDTEEITVADSYSADDECDANDSEDSGDEFLCKQEPSALWEKKQLSISAEYSEDAYSENEESESSTFVQGDFYESDDEIAQQSALLTDNESDFADDEATFIKIKSSHVKISRELPPEERPEPSKKIKYETTPIKPCIDTEEKLADINLGKLTLEDIEISEKSTKDDPDMQKILGQLKKLLIRSPFYTPPGAFFTGGHNFFVAAPHQEKGPVCEIRRPKPSRSPVLPSLIVASAAEDPEELTHAPSKTP